jgi:hypothetical protein
MLDFIRTLTAPFTDSEAQASVLGMSAYGYQLTGVGRIEELCFQRGGDRCTHFSPFGL